MGLLSKLFCKEEPPTAPVPPTPTPPAEEDKYVPFSQERRSITVTCAGCGAQKETESRYLLGDWRMFSVHLKATGNKYDNVVVCRTCRPLFDAATAKRDDEYNAACAPYKKAHDKAARHQRDWDQANPRPKIPSYVTKETWIRRITCGCCGKVVDQEFDISKTPGSIGWPWLVGKRFGSKVCPDCYDKPEHVALRERLEEIAALREEQVGHRFREADKLRPPFSYPEFPTTARMTDRIKRWFSL